MRTLFPIALGFAVVGCFSPPPEESLRAEPPFSQVLRSPGKLVLSLQPSVSPNEILVFDDLFGPLRPGMSFDDAQRVMSAEGTAKGGSFGPTRVFLTRAGTAEVSRETHRSGDYSYQRWALRARPTAGKRGLATEVVGRYLPERGSTTVLILGRDGAPVVELQFAGRTLDEVQWIADR